MDINLNTYDEYQEATKTILKAYYEGFFNMNNPKYHTIITSIEEDRVNLWDTIDCNNRKEHPTNSRN